MAKHAIESAYCSLFGMDAHARSTTVKGHDLSTGKSLTKRFGDFPSASEGETEPRIVAVLRAVALL